MMARSFTAQGFESPRLGGLSGLGDPGRASDAMGFGPMRERYLKTTVVANRQVLTSSPKEKAPALCPGLPDL
jgi:hypothetical protein